jgi:hypothetical protein
MPALLSASRPLRTFEGSQLELPGRSREDCPVDAALSVRVQETLRNSPYRRLHLISTEVRDGVATLRGRVPTFHMKQVAQCLLADVKGLVRVDNRLQVAD